MSGGLTRLCSYSGRLKIRGPEVRRVGRLNQMSGVGVEHSAQEVPIPCCIHQEGDLRVKGQIKKKKAQCSSLVRIILFFYISD